VALVDGAAAERFAQDVSVKYRAAVGLEAKVYVCSASAGASVEAGECVSGGAW
jgi:galactokinase